MVSRQRHKSGRNAAAAFGMSLRHCGIALVMCLALARFSAAQDSTQQSEAPEIPDYEAPDFIEPDAANLQPTKESTTVHLRGHADVTCVQSLDDPSATVTCNQQSDPLVEIDSVSAPASPVSQTAEVSSTATLHYDPTSLANSALLTVADASTANTQIHTIAQSAASGKVQTTNLWIAKPSQKVSIASTSRATASASNQLHLENQTYHQTVYESQQTTSQRRLQQLGSDTERREKDHAAWRKSYVIAQPDVTAANHPTFLNHATHLLNLHSSFDANAPVITGFDGSQYEILGRHGEVFNLLTDTQYQLNAVIAQSSGSATRYITQLGLQVGRIGLAIKTQAVDGRVQVLRRIALPSSTQPAEQDITSILSSTEALVVSFGTPEESPKTLVTLHHPAGDDSSPPTIMIHTPGFMFKFTQHLRADGQGYYFDTSIAIVSPYVHTTHGLIGMTWRNGQPNKLQLVEGTPRGKMEGSLKDYLVRDGLMGLQFDSNLFCPPALSEPSPLELQALREALAPDTPLRQRFSQVAQPFKHSSGVTETLMALANEMEVEENVAGVKVVAQASCMHPQHSRR